MTGKSNAGVPPADGPVSLVRFVRDTLGCGCPDEVLARIALDVSEAGEPGLDVGGRLLVRVLPVAGAGRLVDDFPETVERLVAERDRRGFRRLRLVVCDSQPEVTADVLQGMLHLIVAADEFVYVHVLKHQQLPPMLTGGS